MKPEAQPASTHPTDDSAEMFQQLGALTRQLHDTLNHLGVLPKLKHNLDDLPDARSRLSYIAKKTGDAAERVLNLVDQAKAEQEHITSETRRMADSITADPVRAVASGAVFNFVQDVERTTSRVDQHLTDIMMAQDFHDLTGQVVAKVVNLANELERELVKILVQHAPQEQVQKLEQMQTHRHDGAQRAEKIDPAEKPEKADKIAPALSGPVVDPEARTDVVKNQSEVDDLLASLGF